MKVKETIVGATEIGVGCLLRAFLYVVIGIGLFFLVVWGFIAAIGFILELLF